MVFKRFFNSYTLVLWSLILTSLCIVPALAAAQDIELSDSYNFEDGTSFNYPGDWKLDEKPTYLKVSSTKTDILIVSPSTLESYGLTEFDDLPNLLEAYFRNVFNDSMPFVSGDVQEIMVGDREAVRYGYTDRYGVEGLILAVRFTDDSVGIVDSMSKIGDIAEEDVILALAGTLNRGGEPALNSTPCMVNTPSSGTVAIRVGPGTNRTSYAFLPANQDFVVQGQAEADDGSLWWKLDKEEAAPGKSAAEAWIAQEDIQATGGCTAVVDASAPPLIPIVSGGGGGSAPPPVAGTETQPQSGRWTISYSPFVPVSCLDIPTQNANIPVPSVVVSVSVISSTSIRFDGDIYTRIQSNTYQGFFDFSDGDSVRMTLRVASPTLMAGEFTVNFNRDGHQCSGTFYTTITHN